MGCLQDIEDSRLSANYLFPSPTDAAAASTAPSGRHPALRAVRGMFRITQHSLALVGIGVVLGGALLAGKPELRQQAGQQAVNWLLRTVQQPAADADPALAANQAAVAEAESPRLLATDPSALPRQQAAVVNWISRKYHVAPEPVGLLVQQAWATGREEKIDPALILAIMAIESSFNPFAQSAVGAQGLMQVMTHIHSDKYLELGGAMAAFDPISNMRVGVQVLKETIARSGSLRGGLKYYVGAANQPSDGGYGDKVLAEYARIKAVAKGENVDYNATLPVQVPSIPSSDGGAAPMLVKARGVQGSAAVPTVAASQSTNVTVAYQEGHDAQIRVE